MAPAPRNSSLGGAARRGPLKPHVAYNADDLGHGKRTGMTVAYMARASDGFEPFDQVIGQADDHTPPRAKNTKRSRKKAVEVVEDADDGGEMSMELDDGTPGNPMSYFTNARRAATPPSTSRVGQSSRRRSPDVDFDKVPSPRPRTSTGRKSLGNAGPSNLSHASFAQPDYDDDDGDDGGGGGGFDDYEQPEHSPEQRSMHRKSFAHLSQDNDEDEDEQPIVGKGKGKARQPEPDYDEPADVDMEEDIAQGMGEVDAMDDAEEEEEPPTKKSKQAKARKPREVRKPRIELPASPGNDHPDGVRRGRRHRFAPLDWWRLEKVVYGRSESGGVTLVPHIKEIVRIPKEQVEPLGKHKRKRAAAAPRSKSRTAETPVAIANPEEGWDDDTNPHGRVIDYVTQVEVDRRIAFTASMVQPRAAANSDWFFQKVFGDGDFIAAGQLIIPPKSRKPSKGTKDNTYIFYVIEGAVNLKVHNTSLIIATGGMFLVPRGNTYFIENISERDAKLFFTQARKVPTSAEEEEAAARGRRRSSSTAGPAARSSSAGDGGREKAKEGKAKRAASRA